jgi:hypothetical protein
MGAQVCMGAMLQCSFGAAPSTLSVIPKGASMVNATTLAATIMDNLPIANIPPFAMCSTPSNPAVAALTAAALGVLTPAPCVPVIAAPWAPGSAKVKVGGIPALESNSKLTCTWGGLIQIVNPGQMKVVDS